MVHQLLHFGIARGSGHDAEVARTLEGVAQVPAGGRAVLIHPGDPAVLHIQVDGVAEDQELNQRRHEEHRAQARITQHLAEFFAEDFPDSSPPRVQPHLNWPESSRPQRDLRPPPSGPVCGLATTRQSGMESDPGITHPLQETCSCRPCRHCRTAPLACYFTHATLEALPELGHPPLRQTSGRPLDGAPAPVGGWLQMLGSRAIGAARDRGPEPDSRRNPRPRLV